MKKKKIAAAILSGTFLLSTTGFAKQPEYKLQLFFQSGVMNDITGEVVTDIKIKNTDLAISQNDGDICRVEFECEYDDEVFDVLTDENGKIVITTDENTIIRDSSKITATAENGKIHIIYTDDENLIKYDGTLCRFTLIAKNVNAVWHSFDYYPIRFVEASISVNTSNSQEICNAEGIDGKVGAYNNPVSFDKTSIDKGMVFSLDSTDIQVNGEVINTDAVPFIANEMWMIPMRYFAENIDMTVEWDSEKAMACAYGENKTFKISIKDKKTYINSALVEQEIIPIEKNGRTYISLSLVRELYPDAAINAEGQELLIYIP